MKGSFTRSYNKTSCPLPYATASMSKKKRKRQAAGVDEDVSGLNDEGEAAGGESDQSNDDDDDDIAADSMIKVSGVFIYFFIRSVSPAGNQQPYLQGSPAGSEL